MHPSIKQAETELRAALQKLSDADVRVLGKALKVPAAWEESKSAGEVVTWIMLRMSDLLDTKEALDQYRRLHRSLLS